MELETSPSLEPSYSLDSESGPVQDVEIAWIHVLEQLPEDGEIVQVKLARSGEILAASRGCYQSTGAWFEAKTHTPIYETITHWKSR